MSLHEPNDLGPSWVYDQAWNNRTAFDEFLKKNKGKSMVIQDRRQARYKKDFEHPAETEYLLQNIGSNSGTASFLGASSWSVDTQLRCDSNYITQVSSFSSQRNLCRLPV